MAHLSKRASTVFRTLRCISTCTEATALPLCYMNGQRYQPINCEQTENFAVINPSTGTELCEIRSASTVDVNKSVENAREAQTIWGKLTGLERASKLHKAAELVRSNESTLTAAEVQNVGKPIWEARVDVLGCADVMDYFAGLAPTIEGQHLPLSNGSFGYNIREPLGVCGGIGAWNYPIQMAAWKSAPALACGNTLVFKPSPLTPITAVLLAEIYKEAGLPDGCFNVVQGGVKTGQALCTHPDVAKVTFTGSVAGGSKVMQTCGEGIKQVTLELGGKSAMIVFDDADLENAVKGAMLANFLNQGQVCSNASRVFVQEALVEQFTDLLVQRTKAMKIGDPFCEDTTVGATISKDHADKVLAFINQAKHEGAHVLCGGERVTLEDPALTHGNFLTPCVLSNVQDNMQIAQEEVFGSVLCVLPFKTEDEAIHRANDTELGLAGAVFTNNLGRAHRVVSRFEAGSLCINTYNMYPPGVPFGGYKKSGIGRENCKDTIHAYTQLKSVYVEMNDIDSPF